MKVAQRVADSSGRIRAAGGRGRGFLLAPGGTNPGTFPVDVRFEGNTAAALIRVESSTGIYFGEDDRFDSFDVENAVASSTWTVYVFEREDEKVESTIPTQRNIAGAGLVSPYVVTSTAAPGASAGLSLQGLTGIRVCVYADGGQTLSGAGTLLAWYRDDATGRWYRNPDLDLTVSVSGQGGQAFPDANVLVQRGYVYYQPSGVTVSSGGVNVAIYGAR